MRNFISDRTMFKATLSVVSASQRLPFAIEWMNSAERSVEDLEYVLSLFKSDHKKGNIAASFVSNYDEETETWKAKEGITLERVQEILPLIKADDIKSQIIASLISNYDKDTGTWKAKEGITLEQVQEIVPFITVGEIKSQIIASLISDYDQDTGAWKKKEGITLEEIKEVSPLITVGEITSQIAASLISDYDKKNGKWKAREGITLEEIKEVSPLIVHHFMKVQITASLISDYDQDTYKWKAKEGITLEEIQEVLPLIRNDYVISDIAASLISDYDQYTSTLKVKEGITLEEIKEVLPLLHNVIKVQITTSLIANSDKDTRTWKAKEGITLEQAKEILPLIPDDYIMSEIAASLISDYDQYTMTWKTKEGITLEEIKKVLPFIPVDEIKSQIATSLISDYNHDTGTWKAKKNITVEQLQKALPFISYSSDRYFVRNMKASCIKQAENPLDAFVSLVKAGLSGAHMYDIQAIVHDYQILNLPAASFPQLCHDLYPASENLQTEMFMYGVARIKVDKESSLSFIKTVQDTQMVSDCINCLRYKVDLSEAEILTTFSDHLSHNYLSIAALLKTKTVSESLSPNGLETFHATFNNSVDPSQVTLADLFSYYNFKQDGLVTLKSMLAPDMAQEIINSFVPGTKSPLILKKDFDQIRGFLCDNDQERIRALAIPKVAEVSESLATLPFGNLTRQQVISDDYEIGESILLEESQDAFEETKEEQPLTKRQEVNQEFKRFFVESPIVTPCV